MMTDDIAELAGMKFDPLPVDEIAQLRATLEPDRWNERSAGMRRAMVLAFSVLGRTQADMTESAQRADAETADALLELADLFADQATAARSAAEMFEAARARIFIVLAPLAEGGAADEGEVQP